MGNKSSKKKNNAYHCKINRIPLYLFGNVKKAKDLNNKVLVKSIRNINIFSSNFIVTDRDNNYWVNGWQRNVYNPIFSKDIYKPPKYEKICSSLGNNSIFWITSNGELYEKMSKYNSAPYMKQITALKNVIDTQGSIAHNVALCGSSLISDAEEIKGIISFWCSHDSLIFPADIITIILRYFGQIGTRLYLQKKSGHPINKKWKKISGFKNICIVSISCGRDYSLFLDKTGKVYSCGANQSGQLGLGKSNEYRYQSTIFKPTLLPYFASNKIMIQKICSGYHHNLALDTENNVYSWGLNGHGQCALYEDKKYQSELAVTPRLIQFFEEFCIVDIKADGDNSYAKSDGNLHWIWGDNRYGQCFLGNPGERQSVPFMMNDIFFEKTKAKIKDVYLGGNVTYIVSEQ